MTEKIQQFFDLMKDIEESFLTYMEESNQDTNFFNYLDDKKITENKPKFKSFLYLLVYISNNYHRTRDFYCKIDQILTKYKLSIQNFFTNSEIFHIFQSNKRILLFLIQQKLITVNQGIFDFFNRIKFQQGSYIEYFFPEVEFYLPESTKKYLKNKVKELNENNLEQFNEKRKNGENDSYICSLIRNDQVIDFITYLEKNNISSSSLINKSIFETNHILLKRNGHISLIEYSAFFGSQQIFLYLYKQNIELNSKIWEFVIHGKNGELIHFLEENHIPTLNDSYQYLVIEAIKCHHNEIADYFLLNFCQFEKIYDNYLLQKHLKYYNFNIKFTTKSNHLFYLFCKYDYDFVVEQLLSINTIDINQQYKLYSPPFYQNDIVLSIAIKNGDFNKRPKPKIDDWFMNIDEPKNDEYEIGSNYCTYNYNLDIITALHIATLKGNIDVIQILLNSKEIDIEIQSRKYDKSHYGSHDEFSTIVIKKSLIHVGIESGYVNVVQIISSLNNVDFNENLIISEIYHDTQSTAHMHFERKNHKTLLVLASEFGYSEIFQFLLSEKHLNVNQKSFETTFKSGGCISFSISKKRAEKTPLIAAIQNRQFNIVKLCLKQSKNSVKIPFTVFYMDELDDKITTKVSTLYLAVSNYDIDIVRLLLNQSKVDVNMKSSFRNECKKQIQIRTALHEAVKNEQIEIIKLLLQQKKINLNVLDENQKKPIDYTDDEDIKELFENVALFQYLKKCKILKYSFFTIIIMIIIGYIFFINNKK